MYQAFLGNMGTGRADVKGEIQAVGTVRMRVPMQRTGAEQPVLAMKRGNARGAKGPCLGHAESDERSAAWLTDPLRSN